MSESGLREVSRRRARPDLDSPYVEPRDEIERRFADIFKDVLGLNEVGVDDDFYALGGDESIESALIERLAWCIGQKIPEDSLQRTPTIASLRKSLVQEGRSVAAISLSPSADMADAGTILFCLYGLYLYKPLATELAPEIATYGIYVRDEVDALVGRQHGPAAPAGGLPELPSVEESARTYVEQIRKIQPSGPYRVLGLSFGGLVAFEAAQQLLRAGQQVSFLGLLETFAPRSRQPVSLRGWLSRTKAVLARHRHGAPSGKVSRAARSVVIRKKTMEVARRYRPEVFPSDALLVRAGSPIEYPGYRMDANYGWSKLIDGKLTVCDIPGDHLGILSEPNVAELAEVMKPMLTQPGQGGA